MHVTDFISKDFFIMWPRPSPTLELRVCSPCRCEEVKVGIITPDVFVANESVALMTASPSLCNCGSFAYRTVSMTLCRYQIQVCNHSKVRLSFEQTLLIICTLDSLLRVTCGFVLRYTERGVSFQPVLFDFTCSFVHRFVGAAW